MSNLICLAFTAIFMLPSVNPGSEKFAKYKTIETYEVRPGVLMMPSYTTDGQVCEIGLAKRHYSPEIIRLDSDLSRKEIDEIFEELVPSSERGARLKDFSDNLIVQTGRGIDMSESYENVLVQIDLYEEPPSTRGKTSLETVSAKIVSAKIRWKNRKCQ